MRVIRLVAWSCMGWVVSAWAAHAAEPEPVSFPGPGVTLSGVIYRPDGAGPFPAVVAMHGCGGLWSSRGHVPSARHDDWGRRLAAAGIVVLFPDSFGSRGLWTGAEPCRQLVAVSNGRAEIVVYPGAFHDLDDLAARPRTRTGLAYTVGNTGEARVGVDPAARADALRRVPAFLAGR